MPYLLNHLHQHYGLAGRLHRLGGEVAENYRFDTTAGDRFLVKVGEAEQEAEMYLQQYVVSRLTDRLGTTYALPRILDSFDGQPQLRLPDGKRLRVQTWVVGRGLGEANPRTETLLRQWGELVGRICLALEGADHPAAHRSYRWDPSQLPLTATYDELLEASQQAIARRVVALYDRRFLPLQAKLRKGLNHNDLHESNLIIDATNRLTGLIDFGDVLVTEKINELAIAGAYACMGFPDPLRALCTLVAACHAIYPLQENEVRVLFPLLLARLLISARMAAFHRHHAPENAYLTASEAAAWELLERLIRLDPDYVAARLYGACAMPLPQQSVYKAWLASGPAIHVLLDSTNKTYKPLDLSVGSWALGNNAEWNTPAAFDRRIDRMLAADGTVIGVGGYGETRPFYTTDAYRVEGNQGAQWRTVHLGLDWWTDAGTPIYAPLAGHVHSVHDNAGECDYGPTLILRHSPVPELTFYTLYGHLGRDVLDRWQIGDAVAAGEIVATIGARPVNGGWPPHLHFQILLALWGNTVDFPGVAYPHEAATWLANCPDPAAWFELPNITPPKFSVDLILRKRKTQLGFGMSLSYHEPLHVVRGFGSYLYTSDGRRYLDTVNNVAHVGHEHPDVVAAGQRQMGVLNTNTRYLHANLVRFAESLRSLLPASLSVVHVVNSGSEANELALRMARTYTQRRSIVALEVGYHGNTGGTIAVSSYKFDGKGGAGPPADTHLLPLPDSYRGSHAADPARYASEAVDKITGLDEAPAALIHESILSCGGQVVPPPGYFRQVYAEVRRRGGLCIADEVQTGLGRVGSHWWAFELHGVVPDIVTIGKPLGNGHPVAAVVCTEAVARAFANGMEYFNTFGGNPVSCAIATAVIRTVREEQLRDKALATGMYLMKQLRKLATEFPLIGDVRGVGLFLGVELVRDASTKMPATTQASYLVNRMRERGILMSTDGPDYNVLKLKPPLCFGREAADYLLDNLRLVLAEDRMDLGR